MSSGHVVDTVAAPQMTKRAGRRSASVIRAETGSEAIAV
jgi:hypothetical protein